VYNSFDEILRLLLHISVESSISVVYNRIFSLSNFDVLSFS